LAKTKSALEEAEHGKATNDTLTRKIELLEDELDAAEKNLKETVEKCVPVSLSSFPCLICVSDSGR
jgi:tropomyosin